MNRYIKCLFIGLLLMNLSKLYAQDTLIFDSKNYRNASFNITKYLIVFVDSTCKMDIKQIAELPNIKYRKLLTSNKKFFYSDGLQNVKDHSQLIRINNPETSKNWGKIIIKNKSNIKLHYLFEERLSSLAFEYSEGGYLNSIEKIRMFSSDSLSRICLLPGTTLTCFLSLDSSVFNNYVKTRSGYKALWAMPLRNELSFTQKVFSRKIFNAAATGLFIAILIYNFIVLITLRKREHAFYLLYFVLWTAVFVDVSLFFPSFAENDQAIGVSGLFTPSAYLLFLYFYLENISLKQKRILQVLIPITTVFVSLFLYLIIYKSQLENFFIDIVSVIFILLLIFSIIYAIIISFKSLRKGFKPAAYSLIGMIVIFASAILLLVFELNEDGYITTNNLLLYSVCIEAYILSFGITNKINTLQKEKEQEQQNSINTLELKVRERTFEVLEEKRKVVHQNREILDSIEYAKRIQATILPPPKVVKKYLEDSFILYIPKDIVAGDFYWMDSVELENKDSEYILFAACDCTGHGVPGALVSVVCSNALNRAVREYNIIQPSLILDKVSELVVQDFSKDENEEVQDGMDASLCSLNVKTGKLEWAGANNPLWIVAPSQPSPKGREQGIPNSSDSTSNLESAEKSLLRGDLEGLIEVKPDKQPIGKFENKKPFTNHSIQLQKGDTIYMFTDGYADQFGGEKGKKYSKKALRELVLSVAHLTLQQQREALYNAHLQWRGTNEQVDDICIIGVRV